MKIIHNLLIIGVLLFVIPNKTNAQCPDFHQIKKGSNKYKNAISDFAKGEITGQAIKKYLGKIAGKSYGIWGMIAPSDLAKDADKPELFNIEQGVKTYLKGFENVNYKQMKRGLVKLESAVNEANKRKTISLDCYNDWGKTIDLYKEIAENMQNAIILY